MEGFGHAMEEPSRMSVNAVREPLATNGQEVRTERSMLKRKGHNVLDTLNGHGKRVSREDFADDNLDPTEIIGGAPVALLEQFLAEGGKFETL